MGIMTISVDDSIEERFRKAVAKKFGEEKGAISKGVEFGMEKVIEDVDLEDLRRRAIQRLEKGYKLGFKGYTNRSELYEPRLRKQFPRH